MAEKKSYSKYRYDREHGLIDNDTGLPREFVCCPGCGRRYDFLGRKTCQTCEECEKCCTCKEPKLLTYEQWKPIMVERV